MWFLQCSACDHLRQPLLEAMEGSREDFPVKSVGDRAALVLSLACKNNRILLSGFYLGCKFWGGIWFNIRRA